jgi:uncharacterized protein with ParB-like and HNH nuclease domain
MGYESKSIKEVIKMIGRNEIYLPAIQRKFVWKPEQIESLFDSIMRGYPIGTFLFWFIEERRNEYTFYKFIQDYHERDGYLNDIAPNPDLNEKIIGVLDGQQRLSSMYVALQGTYAYKKPYARWDNDDAFPKRKFYLNLLKEPVEEEEEGYIYEFKFLTDEEARHVDKEHLWFLIREVLMWGTDKRGALEKIEEYKNTLLNNNGLPDYIKDIFNEKWGRIKIDLETLYERLVKEPLISYYKIEEPELDNILDIFVRVNSGGTILSKSDLLFSTIVANWLEGRQEIEELLKTINKEGDGFSFDNDFIMRSCLVLTDCPVLFKVRSFKRENINRIKDQWKDIKTSIIKTVDLLVEFGFNSENLTSQNAVIPIAYYFMKGGNDRKDSKNNIRKYLIHALLKQIYGGQGDRVLSGIRDALRDEENELKRKDFSFKDLIYNAKLPGNKSLKITDEDIEEILEYKKGPYTFMVLSLLYPNLRFRQVKFHQDHIHPTSMFTDAKLNEYGIPQKKWKIWQDMKDRLPNLQLMEESENERKNNTPLKKWLLEDTYPNYDDQKKFMRDNYIPANVSLELKDFESFYEERKKILRNKLKEVLQ